MSFGFVAAVLLTAQGFVIDTFALPNASADCFLADTSADGAADLCVLSGGTLLIHEDCLPGPPRALDLPRDTSAFDIAVWPGEAPEGETPIPDVAYLLGVSGTQIWRMRLLEGAAPEKLFEAETLLRGGGAPFRQVMVVQQEGQQLLALPTATSFELWTLAGERVSVPAEPTSRQRWYDQQFVAYTPRPPRLAVSGGVALRVNHRERARPQLPEELSGLSPLRPAPRPGTTRLLEDTETTRPDFWPRTPLRTSGDDPGWVLYTVRGRNRNETVVRVKPLGRPNEGEPGPERRYPGRPILVDHAFPDFDGDGYCDLLLWNSPQPALSTEALVRALTGGTWPLHLTLHLYMPDKARFAPTPQARITLEPPLNWFAQGEGDAAVEHVVLADLNGDEQVDLTCSPAPQVFSGWRRTAEGFESAPAFEVKTEEPIRDIVFSQTIDAKGRFAMGIRTDTALYMVSRVR